MSVCAGHIFAIRGDTKAYSFRYIYLDIHHHQGGYEGRLNLLYCTQYVYLYQQLWTNSTNMLSDSVRAVQYLSAPGVPYCTVCLC